MLQTSLLHCIALQNNKSRPILNFARFDSLKCIVARSREKSRSLSLAPFLARCRSLSLSLTGLPPFVNTSIISRSCHSLMALLMTVCCISCQISSNRWYAVVYFLTHGVLASPFWFVVLKTKVNEELYRRWRFLSLHFTNCNVSKITGSFELI